MKNFFNILRKCSLFDGIEDENLTALLGCLGAKVVSFDKKYTIFPEGDPAKYIGIVLSGSVHIIQNDYYGNKSIISTAGPTEIFAESFACAEVDAIPVSIIANEPCEVMLIDCHRVLKSCCNSCNFHHQVIFNLMKELASKNIVFHQKIEVTSKRSTREKLLAYLAIEAKRTGSNTFTIPFDRQELADFLQVDRSGLSAEIGKLRKEGIIKSEKSKFTIIA